MADTGGLGLYDPLLVLFQQLDERLDGRLIIEKRLADAIVPEGSRLLCFQREFVGRFGLRDCLGRVLELVI